MLNFKISKRLKLKWHKISVWSSNCKFEQFEQVKQSCVLLLYKLYKSSLNDSPPKITGYINCK